MTNKLDVVEIAEKCGFRVVKLHEFHRTGKQVLQQFADEILERAVAQCYAERVDADATGEESDHAYNQACNDIAAAIRALKGAAHD